MTNLNENGNNKRVYFDALIVVPLEEEFERVVEHFEIVGDVSAPNQLMIAAKLPKTELSLVIAQQMKMGKTQNYETCEACLVKIETGLIICLGIAGGLSNDVSIGDVCYTTDLFDVLDNSKVSESEQGSDISLSPTVYSTNAELIVALSANRTVPPSKETYQEWRRKQEADAKALLPNEFPGKDGLLESIGKPTARPGAIACGPVSASPSFNKKVRMIDRKIIAIETEAGASFSVAKARGIDAISIRGISDYAGADKTKFEESTKGMARVIAANNAATYLVHALSSKELSQYFLRRRTQMETDTTPSFLPEEPAEKLQAEILALTSEYNAKLADLAPSFDLIGKGYKLPIPRVRTFDARLAGPTPKDHQISEIRDAVAHSRVMSLNLPRQYPDASLSWMIAIDLMTQEIDEKPCIPIVIEGSSLQRPNKDITRNLSKRAQDLFDGEIAIPIFIIDKFDFVSRNRAAFLKEQIKAWPTARFVVVTNDVHDIIIESDFTKSTANTVATLCDISFVQIAYFLQKYFELDAPQSEVAAVRLLETFQKYSLPAHPSYFAGIPRSVLTSILQVNRRAELIQLAVVTYLSFVVSVDEERNRLSRTTRERFLGNLAFMMNVEKRNFTEAELVAYADQMSKDYDYGISSSRFIALFIERKILHTSSDNYVRFTLPFIESYLLAARLTGDVESAKKYFDVHDDKFDFRAFAIYAELGPAQDVVDQIEGMLDRFISVYDARAEKENVLLSYATAPAILHKKDRLKTIGEEIRKAIEDVQTNKDQGKKKQSLLDVGDRIRREAFNLSDDDDERPFYAILPDDTSRSQNVWAVAVTLLGSGAEGLKADVKRKLIAKTVKLGALIANDWTRVHQKIDFKEMKKKFREDEDLIRTLMKNGNESDFGRARLAVESLVDFFEYVLLIMPLLTIIEYMCEEGGDHVLSGSMEHVKCSDSVEKLLLDLWHFEVSGSRTLKETTSTIINLPTSPLVGYAVIGHLMLRAFWKKWDKDNQVNMLTLAGETLKWLGLVPDTRELKKVFEKSPEAEPPALPGQRYR